MGRDRPLKILQSRTGVSLASFASGIGIPSRLRIFADNIAVRMLSGKAGIPIDVPFGGCTDSMLAIAKMNIDQNFLGVGLAEYMTSALDDFKKILGWSHLPAYENQRVTKPYPKLEESNPEILERIRWNNRYDIELYEYVRSQKV